MKHLHALHGKHDMLVDVQDMRCVLSILHIFDQEDEPVCFLWFELGPTAAL